MGTVPAWSPRTHAAEEAALDAGAVANLRAEGRALDPDAAIMLALTASDQTAGARVEVS
jgi:hypothetical protein